MTAVSPGKYPGIMHFIQYIFMHILEKLDALIFHINLPWKNTKHVFNAFPGIQVPCCDRSMCEAAVSAQQKASAWLILSHRGMAQEGSLIEIEMSDCHWGCKQGSPRGGCPPAERKPDSLTYHPPIPLPAPHSSPEVTAPMVRHLSLKHVHEHLHTSRSTK